MMAAETKSISHIGLPNAHRERVSAMLDAGVTVARVAIESGNNKRDIEFWLEGKPCAVEVEQRIDVWFEEMDQAGNDAEPDLVATTTSQQIAGALEFARRTPSIALIYGGAGLGKTTTAKRYAGERGRDGRSFYVTASRWTRTPTAILYAIYEAVFGRGPADAYRTGTLQSEILSSIWPGDLLIIDEAQHLDPAALDGIRTFYDESGMGIAYLGNEMVFTRINGKGRAAAFAQLSSRVGRRLHVVSPKDADVDAVLGSWKIVGRQEREYGQLVAHRPGGLRTLTNVLRQSRILARGLDRPVDHKVMRASAKSLGLEE